MSSNCSTKVINILYHKNDEGQSHYVFIKNMNLLLRSVTKPSHKVFVCSLTVHAHTSTHKKTYLGHLEKKHTYIDNEFVCEKYLNTLHTEEAMQIHKIICMMKEWELQLMEYLHLIEQSNEKNAIITCSTEFPLA